MARFGFRKIINHYKNSKNNSVKAPEQKFEAQSEQTEQDVSCGEEIDSIAPEVEMESIPSQEQLYVQDVADLQPTAVPQYELDDYTLPSSRKFTREYHRPNLNVTRSRSRRPKAMRHHNAQRRSCAICRQQEIEAGHSSDGCICDRCNSTIRTTFENFMDETQRFQSGQQAEIDNQAEQQPKTNQSQPTHLDKGQQATDYGERRQQSINPNDVPPPFSIVVLQDCENTDQIIEQLTSVLTQILPQQGRNSINSNNRNSAYSNSCRNILNNYNNACNYNRNYDCNNNSNFDYNNNNNNNNNCYESDYANNRPVSPTNTCTCCPSTFYDNDPAGTRKASADWQYICSCDKDVVGSQPHSKHKTKNHKSSSKRKSNSKSKTKISNKTSHNDDCNCSTYGDDDDDDDDDCKDCGACDCDCCKKNPENEMLLKLFVQVMEMFINSTKQREHPKKEKKSKKGKDGQAKDGSKKGKKKEKSEFGDRAGKVKQGKSKGKQNANGNTQINNSNRILPESDKQHARRQNSNRVGAGDATKCGNAAVTCANSGQRPIDVVPVAKGLRPVAHYRPGIVQHPVTYLLANNGECVRRSLVRTAAGATLHERVYSEVFTSSTNPHRKDYSRNAMRCHSTQFSR